MKVYKQLDYPFAIPKPVITSGTFDGVHVGHRKIIRRVKEWADSIEGESVILTFEPHPRLVLAQQDHTLRLLTTLEEKLDLLDKAGIQHTVVIPFNKEFAAMTSEDFVKNILINTLHIHSLVIGYDHQFGRNREGSYTHLKAMSTEWGFHVEEIPAQDVDDVKVSSTKIRQALLSGDVKTAARYLSYPYQMKGKVIEGNKIGRTIGYPTANILIDNPLKLIPAIGIYAVRVEINGVLHDGMLSIGYRPTIEETANINIEVHIFDFNKDLYGQTLIIHMIDRMRNEEKYDSIEELKGQLHLDKLHAMKILSDIS